MPTRTATSDVIASHSVVIAWAGLLLNDDGSWYDASEHADRTFHVTGTFGGATVTLQGSNDATPGAGFTMTDQAGLPLSFTAAAGKVAAEAPLWVRPFVAGGDGTTSLTVRAVARR